MGYTKFGKIVRKKMIDHDENLGDVASLLDVSTAFVSSVLLGNKSIPENWLKMLSDHYKMTYAEKKELYDAYCEDKKNIKIDVEQASVPQIKLVMQFQRKLPQLTDEEVRALFDILGEEDNGL